MVKTMSARRGFWFPACNPGIKIFADCRENEVLSSDGPIKIGYHLLCLPRSDLPTRYRFPFVRDLLCFFPICLFCASLNAPAVRKRKAGKPKFRAFPLSNACHMD